MKKISKFYIGLAAAVLTFGTLTVTLGSTMHKYHCSHRGYMHSGQCLNENSIKSDTNSGEHSATTEEKSQK